MKPEDLSVIILTYNEQLHIQRCIESLNKVATEVFVVDSFSSDETVNISKQLGAKVYQNPWVNYAAQFQWAIENCPIGTTWVMRMDADEYLSSELIDELSLKLGTLPSEVGGIYLKRREFFLGRWIRYGGYYPLELLRVWRHGVGAIEQRWMDEHIVLSEGVTTHFDEDIIEENLNSLHWWIEKHNGYATREMLDLLNIKYAFLASDNRLIGSNDKQAKRKRIVKEKLYSYLPLGLRSFVYFIYRYIIRLGFMDGTQGFLFHFFQGFWYRLLADAKVYEIERRFPNKEELKKFLRDKYSF